MHYDTELAAVQAIAPRLMEDTYRTGCETCSLIVRSKKGWRTLRPMRGLHNNVIFPAVLMAIVSLFTREAALLHTHPYCNCHNGEEFSGHRDARGRIASMGDVCVPCMGRIRRIWLASPAGVLSHWDGRGEVRIAASLPVPKDRIRFSSRWGGMLPKDDHRV